MKTEFTNVQEFIEYYDMVEFPVYEIADNQYIGIEITGPYDESGNQCVYRSNFTEDEKEMESIYNECRNTLRTGVLYGELVLIAKEGKPCVCCQTITNVVNIHYEVRLCSKDCVKKFNEKYHQWLKDIGETD